MAISRGTFGLSANTSKKEAFVVSPTAQLWASPLTVIIESDPVAVKDAQCMLIASQEVGSERKYLGTQVAQNVVPTGNTNGSATAFNSGQTNNVALTAPLQAGSAKFTLTVSSAEVVLSDGGDGKLYDADGDERGTLDYFSGAWTIAAETAPDASSVIAVTHTSAVLAKGGKFSQKIDGIAADRSIKLEVLADKAFSGIATLTGEFLGR